MDGILLFDKPIGWTSHDAVDFVRRRVGQRAVGHAGTLDPMATGLLVMLIGKATKLSSELMGLEKEYAGTLQLGLETDTQDLEGRIVSMSDWQTVTEDGVKTAFAGLTGPQAQRPPAYSAVKKNGQKLYDLARKGVAVTVEPRSIIVSRFDLLAINDAEVHFRVTCSKGTYIRALASSVGERLGCGAVLSSLVRTRVGAFQLSAALREKDLCTWPREAVEGRLVRKAAA
jgi:tRNA pseudouridine55 synthase